MLYKCYKQVIAYGIFRVPFRIFRFVSGAEAKFYIPDSYNFKSFEIVRDELQLLLIRIRRFLQRIIYYNYISVVTKP